MTSIEKILKAQGPMLSGELLRVMEAESPGISAAAIRKRLSRMQAPVKRVFGFFADRQVFYYLEEHSQTQLYYNNLGKAVAKAAKRIDAFIAAIEFHRGYIHEGQMAVYGFCPVENLIGHKNFESYFDLLIQFNFIRRWENDCYTLSVDFNSHGGFDFKKHKAEETAKNFVLSQFSNWARNIGLVSYNTGTFYSNFGKFQWCYTRGTQFRIWANQVLKDFLVKGYALNEKRLREQSELKIVKGCLNLLLRHPLLHFMQLYIISLIFREL